MFGNRGPQYSLRW